MKLPTATRYRSDYGVVRLQYRTRSRSLVYEQRGGNQSAVDECSVSLDSYIHASYGLVLQHAARKVLLIGCGGGTLGTMLARTERKVTIVDIDKISFVLAKRYFGLLRDVECHVDDGLAFMQKSRRRFDVVIVDVLWERKFPSNLPVRNFSPPHAVVCAAVD